MWSTVLGDELNVEAKYVGAGSRTCRTCNLLISRPAASAADASTGVMWSLQRVLVTTRVAVCKMLLCYVDVQIIQQMLLTKKWTCLLSLCASFIAIFLTSSSALPTSTQLGLMHALQIVSLL